METIITVAVGVFAGLALWSGRDSLGAMLLIGVVILVLLALCFLLFSTAKSSFFYLRARIFIIPKISRFIAKKNLVVDREMRFFDDAILDLSDSPRLDEILLKYQRLETWSKEGVQTPHEETEFAILISKLIHDYKAEVKKRYRANDLA